MTDGFVIAEGKRARRADDERLNELDQMVPRGVVLEGLVREHLILLPECFLSPVPMDKAPHGKQCGKENERAGLLLKTTRVELLFVVYKSKLF